MPRRSASAQQRARAYVRAQGHRKAIESPGVAPPPRETTEYVRADRGKRAIVAGRGPDRWIPSLRLDQRLTQSV